MTKHPQTRLGYYVNGKLVLKPIVRPVSYSSTKKAEHTVRNIDRRAQLATLERQRQLCQTLAAVRRQSWAYREAKEDLKNASKVGNLGKVLEHVGTMLSAWPSSLNSSVAALSIVVQILYTPDSEERTALYYACHTGHTSLVRFYLSVHVLERALSRVGRRRYGMYLDAHTPRTFREWFLLLGAIPGIAFSVNRGDYDLCHLNALHDNVRSLLHKRKVSLYQVTSIVVASAAAFPECKKLLTKHPIMAREMVRHHLQQPAATWGLTDKQKMCWQHLLWTSFTLRMDLLRTLKKKTTRGVVGALASMGSGMGPRQQHQRRPVLRWDEDTDDYRTPPRPLYLGTLEEEREDEEDEADEEEDETVVLDESHRWTFSQEETFTGVPDGLFPSSDDAFSLLEDEDDDSSSIGSSPVFGSTNSVFSFPADFLPRTLSDGETHDDDLQSWSSTIVGTAVENHAPFVDDSTTSFSMLSEETTLEGWTAPMGGAASTTTIMTGWTCAASKPNDEDDSWDLASTVSFPTLSNASVGTCNAADTDTDADATTDWPRKSYKDVSLTPNNAQTTPVGGRTTTTTTTARNNMMPRRRPATRRGSENDDPDDDDDVLHQLRDGVKGGRGGRGKFLFKGNQRTPRYGRYGMERKPTRDPVKWANAYW